MSVRFAGKCVPVMGAVSHFYFAGTFGMCKGEVYGMRHGDTPYPLRDFWTVTSSYVLGLGTSFETQP